MLAMHKFIKPATLANLVSLFTGSLLALGFIALLASPLGAWVKLGLAIAGGTLAGVAHAKAQLYLKSPSYLKSLQHPHLRAGVLQQHQFAKRPHQGIHPVG
jgi:hypothetical protein